MAWGISGDARTGKVYVVACKRCHRHIPACPEFPKDNIRVDCPLCGEKRRYRPTEVYLGFTDSALQSQHVNHAQHYRRLRNKLG